jgi:hypothetical protein
MAGISYVFTISRVAEMLGEDEEWLDEISIVLDPEDGRLGVLGLGDESTAAFTALASITSPSLSKSIKPIPIYFPDLNRASELAAVLTGCERVHVRAPLLRN